MTLFPDFDDMAVEAEAERVRLTALSAGQRLTARQAKDVTEGRHPLTGGALHPLASRNRDSSAPKDDPFTCGSCWFRSVELYHNRSYPKCWLPGPDASGDKPTYPRVTNGPASDVRAWWPACPDYSPSDRLSNDAARHIPDGA